MPGNKFKGLPALALHELLYHVLKDYLSLRDNPASSVKDLSDSRELLDEILEALDSIMPSSASFRESSGPL